MSARARFRPLLLRLKSDFAANVVTLVSGVAFANLIGLLLSPIITRIYEPAAFGVLAVYLAIAQIVSRVSGLTLEQVVVLTKHEKAADAAFTLTLLIAFLATAVVATITVITKELPSITSLDMDGTTMLLIPIVLLKSLLFVSSFLLIRQKKFKQIGLAMAAEAIIGSSLKILLGWSIAASAQFIIAGAIGGLVAALIIQSWAIKESIKRQFGVFSKRKLSWVLRRYRQFLSHNAPTVLLNTSVQNAPPLMFTAFYGASITGLYSLANRMVNLPSRYIGNAFQKAYLQRASEIRRDNADLFGSLRNSTIALCLIGFPPFLMLYLYGGDLFALVFGSSWREAGTIAGILAPGMFCVLANKGAYVIYTVLERVRFRFYYTVVYAFARLSALTLGFSIYSSVEVSLWLYSGVLCIFNLYFIGSAFMLARRLRHA